jgi:hypothetical protein
MELIAAGGWFAGFATGGLDEEISEDDEPSTDYTDYAESV